MEAADVDVLSTAGLRGRVDHEPMDLMVTAPAGLRVAELGERLASREQWLPVGRAGSRQSVGGLVAAAFPGRWDETYGPVRRHLLALEAVNRHGTIHRWGRRVVKNVAGYDVPRLFCGSFGRLGTVLQATFRVWSRPETRRRLQLVPGLPALEAYTTLTPGEEFGADALAWKWRRPPSTPEGGGVLQVELRGSARSVADRRGRLRRWTDDAGLSIHGEDDLTDAAEVPEPDDAELAERDDAEDGELGTAGGGARRAGAPARRLDESVVRLQLESAGLPAAVSGVRDAGRGAVRELEAFPRPGVLRARLRTGGAEDAVALLDGIRRATSAISFAVERGPPGLHEAMQGRRDEGVRSLEARVVEALGGRSRHWLGGYL